MKWIPGKKSIWTVAACAAGAAVLFFPGSVILLALGAGLGVWGKSRFEHFCNH